jgi:hypothetical protein
MAPGLLRLTHSLLLSKVAGRVLMLFSLYPTLTRHYFILCFVVTVGVLQWAAARNDKPAISLLGPWGLSRAGQLAGLGLVSGGFAWFLAATPGFFDSGLAGGELSILFSLAGLSGLAFTRLLARFWQGVMVWPTLAQSGRRALVETALQNQPGPISDQNP